MNEREKGGADWYRKGTEAMQHKNWGYAVECFTNCVRLVPDNCAVSSGADWLYP
ncbi:MAG UNVERIFIED_CONTAM: tetratricopeptide repeat protein [Planctomycetaceae bacterium]|jgi:cytochrome c-type biogenesis protein CcmH/NrfG